MKTGVRLGGKKATRVDVARLAGVSASTVSRAMSNSPLITEEVKQRVRQAASALGYVPSLQASLFARNRTKTLGFVVPSYPSFPPFSRPYFPTLLDGVVLAAEKHGYSVKIVLDKVDTKKHDYQTMIEGRSLDGLVFSVTKADFGPFLDLAERKIPFVLVNNYFEGMSSVDARPEPGMRQAFESLWSSGHRSLGYIQGDLRFRNAQDRWEVFKSLAAEWGAETLVVPGDFSQTSGYKGAAMLLESDRRPTVILTSSDRAAYGVMHYCQDHGIRIPEDLSLVGYDNLYPSEEVQPPLSTIDQHIASAGSLAVEMLIGMLDGEIQEPVQEWLDTKFIQRGTTRSVSKKAAE